MVTVAMRGITVGIRHTAPVAQWQALCKATRSAWHMDVLLLLASVYLPEM